MGNGSPHGVLRELEDRDLDVLFEHWTDPEAIRMAAEFPWAKTGTIEVGPIRDIETVRQRVNSVAATSI